MPNLAAPASFPATVRILCLISFLVYGGVASTQPHSEETLWQEPPRLRLDSELRGHLHFPDPTAVDQIYSALAETFQLGVVLDPLLKPRSIQLRLFDVTALEALEAVTRAGGHLFSPQGPKSVMIADNTPQMRRKYEQQALKTFQLKHADLKQIGTALRSVLGLKHVAFDHDSRRITIRDSLAKLELAQVLIDNLDLPRAEFDVDVEWLLLTPAEEPDLGEAPSSEIRPGSMETSGTGRILLTDIESAKHRRKAELLESATVSVMAGEVGRHRLVTTLLGPDGEPIQTLRLELILDLDIDDETENLSLWIKAKSQVTPNDPSGPNEDREIASNFHLEKGFGYWMGRLGEACRSPSGGTLRGQRSGNAGPLEIAAVVRARVARPAPIPELDNRLYWTGSEARIRASNTVELSGENEPTSRNRRP